MRQPHTFSKLGEIIVNTKISNFVPDEQYITQRFFQNRECDFVIEKKCGAKPHQ